MDIQSVLTILKYLFGVMLTAALTVKTIYKIKELKMKTSAGDQGLVPLDAHSKTLRQHTLFKSLVRIRRTVKNKLDLGSSVRTAVFKDIMVKKVDVWGKLLMNQACFIDRNCKASCGHACAVPLVDLMNHNEHLVQDGIDIYTFYYIDDVTYSPEDKEILGHAVASFNKQHHLAVGMVLETINSIRHNSQYGYCAKAFQSDIFNAYEIGMKIMLNQSVKALEKSNGFYDNKKFEERTYADKADWMADITT